MLRVASALVAFFLAFASTACADEEYRVIGRDELEILGTTIESRTLYNGLQHVIVTPLKLGAKNFVADVQYRVDRNGSVSNDSAHAEVTLGGQGEQQIVSSSDPAYLTVVTQPFAVALDAKTLHDVTLLRKPVPFRFTSGMTGGNLQGLLEFRGFVKVNDFHTVGITFTADGPLSGSLPGKPKVSLTGRVHMDGRAFYRASDALLMKLDTRIVTSGTVGTSAAPVHIRVTYERELLHLTPTPVPTATPTNAFSENSSPTPLPSGTPTSSPVASAAPTTTAPPTPTLAPTQVPKAMPL